MRSLKSCTTHLKNCLSWLPALLLWLSVSLSLAASPDARQPSRQPPPGQKKLQKTTARKAPAKSKAKSAKKSDADGDRYWVRYTLLGAKLWPVKINGGCWDSCWSTGKLPARKFFPYKHYLKNPNFKALTSGVNAPDVQVELQIGKHLLKTPTVDNTTQPTWNLTRLWRVSPKATWHIRVYDVDTFSKELVGELKGVGLPASWLKNGVITLRKFGQVESLQIKVFSLFPLKGKLPVAKTKPVPTRKPAKTDNSAKTKKPAPRIAKTTPLKKQEPQKNPAKKVAKAPVVRPQPRVVEPRKPAVRTVVVKKQTIPAKPPARRSLLAKRTEPAKRATIAARSGKKPAARKGKVVKKKKPGILVLVTIESATIAPLRKNGQCWDTCVDKGKMKTLRQRWLNQLSPPDVRLTMAIGKRRWKTPLRSNSIKPVWKHTVLLEVDPDDSFVVNVEDEDTLSNETIGNYRSALLPKVFTTGGVWKIPSFGQVQGVTLRVKRLKRLPPAPKSWPTASKTSDVQFVRITLKRARIWPVDGKGRCWDACPTTSVTTMPPRGVKDFKQYQKDKRFSQLTKGTLRPDPKVRIQLGPYDIYVSPTQTDTLLPVWNSSHLFRLRGNEDLRITVFDDDENIAHDALRTYRPTRNFINKWWANSVIGQFHSKKLPAVFLQGGRWVLRSFGQVELLELEVRPVQVIRKTPGCDGVYRVRVAELEIFPTRANGKHWHPGVGMLRNPSPYATLWLGNQKLETTVAYKSLKAVFQTSQLIPIRGKTSLVLEVKDYSTGVGVTLDKKYKIPFLPLHIRLDMKKESASHKIGQTAYLSICKLLKKSKNGSIRLPSFGRVKSALLFFDKVESQKDK